MIGYQRGLFIGSAAHKILLRGYFRLHIDSMNHFVLHAFKTNRPQILPRLLYVQDTKSSYFPVPGLQT